MWGRHVTCCALCWREVTTLHTKIMSIFLCKKALFRTWSYAPQLHVAIWAGCYQVLAVRWECSSCYGIIVSLHHPAVLHEQIGVFHCGCFNLSDATNSNTDNLMSIFFSLMCFNFTSHHLQLHIYIYQIKYLHSCFSTLSLIKWKKLRWS